MKILCLFIMLVFGVGLGCGRGEPLEIATDQNFWYPFTFARNGEARGIHIDLVAKALETLGIEATFTPLPWKRCLLRAKRGTVDAIVSASYRPDRAAYLIYPRDADVGLRSRWRITQVEYIVVTHRTDAYIFAGDVSTLPPPVRAPLGYSIVEDLRASGIDVVTAVDIHNCVQQLIQTQRGVVITPPQNAYRLEQEAAFKGHMKIHTVPVTSKSYFMAFCRKGRKIALTRMQAIWDEIARLREDKTVLNQLFHQYARAMDP